MNTAIFFADGFEEIEGLTVVDMFRRAGIPIQTVSISDSLTVTGSHDIKVQADCLLADFDFNTVETDEEAQKYTAEVAGKFPIIKDLDIDYDKAPAQLKYVQDIMDKATGTFGFYNESLASVEAGDCFDNAMVDVFLGNQTPEEAFQTVQDFYEENVWK